MARHEEGDIEGALAEARTALELAPQFADARSYLGSTLITKQGRYAEGLAELERAREAAMDDPALHYTIGWCYEFVAYRITRRPRRSAKGGSTSTGRLEPAELYRKAEESLRRCLELRPEGKLKDDAKDLLSAIIKEDVN
ncbi:MAG: tetratricopeptide repeat protein [Chloroflexi bacterium]|nr:tetratricopeptide repeat protein [Chloroflexota bacterium]